MGLNESKGNMYDFITHTWNAVKGKCSHDCTYCYMKRWGVLRPLRFDEKELRTDLGAGDIIFVGSSTDMFANVVPRKWIIDVLGHCRSFNNRYLFQSKNPGRFREFRDLFPENIVLGTTIETNRENRFSQAPAALSRAMSIPLENETMVTIEPIMDFELDDLIDTVKLARPSWVNIGADSQSHKLPEPSYEKVEQLIDELSAFTVVRQKKNLGRLKRGN